MLNKSQPLGMAVLRFEIRSASVYSSFKQNWTLIRLQRTFQCKEQALAEHWRALLMQGFDTLIRLCALVVFSPVVETLLLNSVALRSKN